MTTVGIDLGTTISSVSRADSGGHVTLARLRDGTPRLRSVVTIEPDGRTAWSALAEARGRRVIVRLTDGSPNSREDTLAEAAIITRSEGEIIARGVQGADHAFLKQLDSGSELLGSGQLVSSFRGVAKQLAGGGGGGFAGLGRRR